MKNKQKGIVGEKLAKEYLKRKGYLILHKNWYCRWGEIDIIAKDKNKLVFVEVKFRSSEVFGDASKAITKTKIRSLRRSIWRYIYINHLYQQPCRLDIICILKKQGRYKLDHYRSVVF